MINDINTFLLLHVSLNPRISRGMWRENPKVYDDGEINMAADVEKICLRMGRSNCSFSS